MTNTPDYLKPYRDAVVEHGGTFDATLWQSKEGQLLRFKTFCNFIDFIDTTILDIGCGIGDFSEYLTETGVAFKSFHGIDAMAPMIATANERQLARSTFSIADIVHSSDALRGYDWITFSGTLNAMREDVASNLIETAFKHSSKGVAFNFLSNKSGRDPASEDITPASRFDTLAWISKALLLSPNVDFTQSYLDGHDATIVIHS